MTPWDPLGDALAGSEWRLRLSVREAAQRLSVSTATVYALCDRGELAHVRVLLVQHPGKQAVPIR